MTPQPFQIHARRLLLTVWWMVVSKSLKNLVLFGRLLPVILQAARLPKDSPKQLEVLKQLQGMCR
jgi:hypothetical protein